MNESSDTSLNKQSQISLDKPIVVFTNFWDANASVRDGHMIVSKNDEYFKLNLLCNSSKKPENYEVLSIALQHPPLAQLPHIEKTVGFIHTINHLCPTYDILMARKNGGTWEKYTEDFNQLMRHRKLDIKRWIEGLTNKIHILCCWENTSGKATCHRQLLYDSFSKSTYANSKLLLFYRHGGKKDIVSVIPPESAINMGEKGLEPENTFVTKMKKLGVIEEAPRTPKQSTYIQGDAVIYTQPQINTLVTQPVSDPMPLISNVDLFNLFSTDDCEDNRLFP